MKPSPRPWIERLEPYVPGQRGPIGDGNLASNENALGAPKGVVDAVVAAALDVHRYPDPLADDVRFALADSLSVAADSLLVGNGSDELIYLLLLAYAAYGGRVLVADPPYRVHEIAAQALGATVTRVPLIDWVHDLEGMAQVDADVVFVCNPHNPAGTALDADDVMSFVAASRARLVVVDEAYIDFAQRPERLTVVDRAARGEVVVLRTFSKLLGLAGLRVGYLVAAREVVDTLRRIRPPFSVNSLAQVAAVAALDDHAHAEATRAHVRRVRQEVTRVFEEAGFAVVPSEANFVLVLTPDERSLSERLAEHGVLVRPGSDIGVAGAVRVTLPSLAGLRLLEEALR